MDTREELRIELEAMLAAGRELSPDTDRYLAERFLDRLGTKRPQTRRRHRHPTRKPRRPGRTAATLLVAGLALAIGTPLSLHANQNNTSTPGYAIAARPSSCSWHTQLMVFHSMKDLAAFQEKDRLASQERIGSKSYRFFPRTTKAPDGRIAVRAIHWECP